jgi:putative salt-induced outer membrane protein YdiY
MTMPRPRAALTGACAWLAVALCAWSTAALADKTDVIQLRNGDRITGEIKNLQRGRLQLSTDSMGTVYVEWKDIARITSPELYVIELQDGTRFDGSFEATDKDNRLLLAYEGKERYVDMQSVVFVDPLKLDVNRLRRWDGSVSAGFDATKANNTSSLSATVAARRRAEDFLISINGSVFLRSQDEVDDNLRASLNAVYRGLLEKRWFWAGVGGVERNDELGIDLRSLAGAGYGRYLVQTGRALWSATAGLSVVNEQRAGDEDAETNLEGFLNTEFEYFTYDSPKTSLTTSLTLFPSVTDSGRIRGNFELGLRRELISDLFLEISFYNSYDSRPPEEGENSDYGIVTSLGYTF